MTTASLIMASLLGLVFGCLVTVVAGELRRSVGGRDNRIEELEKRVRAQEDRFGSLAHDLWRTQLYVEKQRKALAEMVGEDKRARREDG